MPASPLAGESRPPKSPSVCHQVLASPPLHPSTSTSSSTRRVFVHGHPHALASPRLRAALADIHCTLERVVQRVDAHLKPSQPNSTFASVIVRARSDKLDLLSLNPRHQPLHVKVDPDGKHFHRAVSSLNNNSHPPSCPPHISSPLTDTPNPPDRNPPATSSPIMTRTPPHHSPHGDTPPLKRRRLRVSHPAPSDRPSRFSSIDPRLTKSPPFETSRTDPSCGHDQPPSNPSCHAPSSPAPSALPPNQPQPNPVSSPSRPTTPTRRRSRSPGQNEREHISRHEYGNKPDHSCAALKQSAPVQHHSESNQHVHCPVDVENLRVNPAPCSDSPQQQSQRPSPLCPNVHASPRHHDSSPAPADNDVSLRKRERDDHLTQSQRPSSPACDRNDSDARCSQEIPMQQENGDRSPQLSNVQSPLHAKNGPHARHGRLHRVDRRDRSVSPRHRDDSPNRRELDSQNFRKQSNIPDHVGLSELRGHTLSRRRRGEEDSPSRFNQTEASPRRRRSDSLSGLRIDNSADHRKEISPPETDRGMMTSRPERNDSGTASHQEGIRRSRDLSTRDRDDFLTGQEREGPSNVDRRERNCESERYRAVNTRLRMGSDVHSPQHAGDSLPPLKRNGLHENDQHQHRDGSDIEEFSKRRGKHPDSTCLNDDDEKKQSRVSRIRSNRDFSGDDDDKDNIGENHGAEIHPRGTRDGHGGKQHRYPESTNNERRTRFFSLPSRDGTPEACSPRNRVHRVSHSSRHERVHPYSREISERRNDSISHAQRSSDMHDQYDSMDDEGRQALNSHRHRHSRRSNALRRERSPARSVSPAHQLRSPVHSETSPRRDCSSMLSASPLPDNWSPAHSQSPPRRPSKRSPNESNPRRQRSSNHNQKCANFPSRHERANSERNLSTQKPCVIEERSTQTAILDTNGPSPANPKASANLINKESANLTTTRMKGTEIIDPKSSPELLDQPAEAQFEAIFQSVLLRTVKEMVNMYMSRERAAGTAIVMNAVKTLQKERDAKKASVKCEVTSQPKKIRSHCTTADVDAYLNKPDVKSAVERRISVVERTIVDDEEADSSVKTSPDSVKPKDKKIQAPKRRKRSDGSVEIPSPEDKESGIFEEIPKEQPPPVPKEDETVRASDEQKDGLPLKSDRKSKMRKRSRVTLKVNLEKSQPEFNPKTGEAIIPGTKKIQKKRKRGPIFDSDEDMSDGEMLEELIVSKSSRPEQPGSRLCREHETSGPELAVSKDIERDEACKKGEVGRESDAIMSEIKETGVVKIGRRKRQRRTRKDEIDMLIESNGFVVTSDVVVENYTQGWERSGDNFEEKEKDEEEELDAMESGCARIRVYRRGEFVKKLGVDVTPRGMGPEVKSSREARQELRRFRKGMRSINPNTDVMTKNALMQCKKGVYFRRSLIHGMGLFARENIESGEFVIEYIGEIIRRRVADEREKIYRKQGMGDSYLFRLNAEMVVDATHKGGIARFINHSCDPNVIARIMTIGSEEKILFYSKRSIRSNEELTYDYKFDFEEEDKKIPCLCKSANCRKSLN